MPERIVVWDIDRTIIRSSLERHFLAYLRRRVDTFSILKTIRNIATLSFRVPPPAWYQVKLAYLRGFFKAEIEDWFRECFIHDIQPAMYSGASTAIRKLQIENVRQVLLSGTPRPFAEQIALHFGLSDIIAAEPEFVDARYSGRLLRHHPHGQFKALYLEDWLTERGYGWTQVAALADHYDDRFLLDKAAVAIAVNPSPQLKRVAVNAGWAIVPDAALPSSLLSVLEKIDR
jgi:HAD superfamily phosphoserine phosphatase-like hydrolase